METQSGKHSPQDILTRMADLERAIGDLYTACAERWLEEKDLWEALAKAEAGHAKLIEQMHRLATRKPDDFQVNREFNPIVVNTVIEMVRDITHQVKEGKITLYKAVVRAHDIEHSLLEKELPNLVNSKRPEFLDAQKTIRSETNAHRALLQEKLSEFRGE